MVKVSVIIPVYNVEKYLDDCLNSVLTQSLQDIEVICIDDKSPDRCPEMLDAYAAKDERVKVIHLAENHQQGYGRNRGMEKAVGKYIYLLDSDDMIAEGSLEALYNCAEKDQLDGIFFDSQVLFESKDLERKNAGYMTMRIGKYPDAVLEGKELYELFNDQQEWTCFIQRQLWRREFLLEQNIWFPEHTEHEDEVFAFEAILTAQRVRYLREGYFIHRYRPNSVMTSKPAPKNFYGYLRSLYMMEEFARTKNLMTPAARCNLARMNEQMVRLYGLLPYENLETFMKTKTEDERKYFHFFAAQQNTDLYMDKYLNADLVERLEPYRKIYIYGTGIVANRVFQALVRKQCIIEGFLLTKRNPDMKAYQGRPVYTPDELACPEDGIALIAVSRGYRKEIEENLERCGWRSIYYKR